MSQWVMEWEPGKEWDSAHLLYIGDNCVASTGRWEEDGWMPSILVNDKRIPYHGPYLHTIELAKEWAERTVSGHLLQLVLGELGLEKV